MKAEQYVVRSLCLIALSVLAIAVSVVLGISYYAMRSIVYAGDRVVHGKKTSEMANEIRAELLKRTDLSQISIPSTDAITLAAFLIERKKPVGNLLLCHGFRGSKELMYAFIELFPNWNILMFDFRAHGQSNGTITSIGCHEYKDVLSAAHFMRQHALSKKTNTLPFVIIGLSMGGASSIRAAEADPKLCDAMIIDSAYARLDTTVMKGFSIQSKLPRYPFFPIVKWMFHQAAQCNIHSMSPVESVSAVTMPILFIHSCNDSYIPPKNALQLYAKAQNKKSALWIGPACRHSWLHTYYRQEYKDQVEQFLQKVL